MERKTSFLLYAEQKEAIKRLNNEQRGMLLTALLAAAGGDMDLAEQLDASTGVAFDGIWLQVGIDRQKFEETSERRAEAGRNGGLASGETRRQQLKQTEANEAKASKPKQTKQGEANEANEANRSNVKQTKQSEANEAKASKSKQTKQNENENENENDSTTWKKESGKKKAAGVAGLLPDLTEGEADRLKEAFTAFAEMRKKQKAPLTEDAARLTANELRKFATRDGRFDVDLAVAILNQSTQRSWRGVFPLKEEQSAAAPQTPATRTKPGIHYDGERQYDYGAMEQMLREKGRREAAEANAPP